MYAFVGMSTIYVIIRARCALVDSGVEERSLGGAFEASECFWVPDRSRGWAQAVIVGGLDFLAHDRILVELAAERTDHVEFASVLIIVENFANWANLALPRLQVEY